MKSYYTKKAFLTKFLFFTIGILFAQNIIIISGKYTYIQGLNEDPRNNINTIENVNFVMKNGIEFKIKNN